MMDVMHYLETLRRQAWAARQAHVRYNNNYEFGDLVYETIVAVGNMDLAYEDAYED